MRFLSLFAGIGGFDLGLERAGMECVGQVEIDPFCQKVLAKHWPNVKRMADIREVKGDEFGTVDLVCGGFPCQPFSSAGKRRGQKDDRHLWPQMCRVIRTARPRFVIGENVAGIIRMALDQVLAELEGIGYACQALVVPACAVGAPHRRDRVWVVARDVTSPRASTVKGIREGAHTNPNRIVSSVRRGEWQSEPNVGRVVHGIPNRLDRLKALGNAVVPQVVEVIGRAILTTESAFKNIEAATTSANSASRPLKRPT